MKYHEIYNDIYESLKYTDISVITKISVILKITT